jgi:spermidine/putrescine transport system substrate-binding protein
MRVNSKLSIIVGILATLLLVSCGGGGAAEQGPLVMIDWSGYELPEFWTGFAEEHPDVEVEFSFMSESADVYAQLVSGYEADLIHPCNQYWQLLVDEELVQPIDTSRLENWPNMMERLTAEGNFNGQQYWVPWDWGFEAILVRTDLVEEVPTSWADLWDPQYAGHLAVYDSGESMHVITAMSMGLDPWATTPEEDAAIRERLMELVPNVLVYWSDQTELDQLVASGDVWVAANAWNASYIALLGEGYEVDYISPEEGSLGYLCGFAIPTTSQNPDLAHDMIDAYIAVPSQTYLANEYGYGIVNTEAVAQIDPEMADLLGLTDSATIDNMVFYQPVTAEVREFWANEWSEVKASQ